jgi:DNA-binding IclR family transcriptional regulator
VTDEEVLASVPAVAKSVWTLELLLLLRRQRERAWKLDELVRELRASRNVVQIGMYGLQACGLAGLDDDAVQYRPASERLDVLAAAIEQLYLTKPFTVINAIAVPGDEKLRIFAESFRLKE